MPYDITYMWDLECDTNPSAPRNRYTGTENRVVVEGKDWEFGISRCKLLCIGWINNKVLLYSAGNYIQHPVISHNRKEYFEKKVCVYLYVCMHAKLLQFYLK